LNPAISARNPKLIYDFADGTAVNDGDCVNNELDLATNLLMISYLTIEIANIRLNISEKF
jgi:hypothetical protein